MCQILKMYGCIKWLIIVHLYVANSPNEEMN